MRSLILSTLAACAIAGGAAAQVCEAAAKAMPAVAETIEFRLVDGVSDQDFLAAAAASMTYLCSAEGFVRRSLSRDKTGLWTDHVEWADADLAQMAFEAAMQREDLLPFMMSIDPDSISLRYSDILLLN